MASDETVVDILREMREIAKYKHTISPIVQRRDYTTAEANTLASLADRIEAAVKRETAVAESATTTGDNAKMREALTKVKEWMERRIATRGFETSATFPTMLEDVVLPALAAPARNCDKMP